MFFPVVIVLSVSLFILLSVRVMTLKSYRKISTLFIKNFFNLVEWLSPEFSFIDGIVFTSTCINIQDRLQTDSHSNTIDS